MYFTEKELQTVGFGSLGENVQISSMCSVYNPANIHIGNNVRIDDFTVLSAGEGIYIGNYVHIGCYASIVGRGKVTMADYSGISARVSIFSSSDSYDGKYMTNPTLPPKVVNTYHLPVHLGKHVVVGAGSVILPGVDIGEGTAIGAMSLVTYSFENDLIAAGIPAKVIKRRNTRIYELEKLIDQ